MNMKKSLFVNCDNFLTYYYMGVLNKLNKEDKLKDITNYVGVSLGSLLCLFLLLDTDLEKILHNKDLCYNEINSFYFTSEHTTNEEEKYYKKFKQVIEELIFDQIDIIPTLSQLYLKTKKEFNVGVYNKNKMKIEYLSHFTNPSMSVLDAIFYSCDLADENTEYNYFINPSFLNLNVLLNEFNTKNFSFECFIMDGKTFIGKENLNQKHVINYENQKIFKRENTKVIYPKYNENLKLTKEKLFEEGNEYIEKEELIEEDVNVFLK